MASFCKVVLVNLLVLAGAEVAIDGGKLAQPLGEQRGVKVSKTATITLSSSFSRTAGGGTQEMQQL